MDWKTIIDKVQARRGLTQPQIAALAGCTQSAVSQLYSGAITDPRYSIGSRLVALAADKQPTKSKQQGA